MKEKRKLSLGCISLVLGILGCLLSFILIGVPFAIAAIVCAILALKKKEKKTFPVLGLVFSTLEIVMLLIAVWGISMTSKAESTVNQAIASGNKAEFEKGVNSTWYEGNKDEAYYRWYMEQEEYDHAADSLISYMKSKYQNGLYAMNDTDIERFTNIQAQLSEQKKLDVDQFLALVQNEKTEEESRQKAEEESRKKAMEEAKKKAEEESKQKAEEESKQKAEEESKQKAEEESRKKAEEESKQKAEEESRQKAEEEESRKTAEQESKKKAEEESKQKAEEESRQKAEEESKQKAEEESRNKAEEDAKRIPEFEEIQYANTYDYKDLCRYGNEMENMCVTMIARIDNTYSNNDKHFIATPVHREYSEYTGNRYIADDGVYHLVDMRENTTYKLLKGDVIYIYGRFKTLNEETFTSTNGLTGYEHEQTETTPLIQIYYCDILEE